SSSLKLNFGPSYCKGGCAFSGISFVRTRTAGGWKRGNETNPLLRDANSFLVKAITGGFNMNIVGKNWCRRLLLAGIVATTLVPASARADVIINWNIKSDEIAAQKQILPFNHSRGTAMLHVAMFEAVNAVEGRYLPYKLNLTVDRNTSKE